MGVREEYEKRKKEQSAGQYQGVRFHQRAANAEKVGKEITARVDTWVKNHNQFLANYQSRYKGGNDTWRADSSDWLSTVTSQKGNFDTEANYIKTILADYSGIFDEKWVSEVSRILDEGGEMQRRIVSDSSKDHRYWSQWDGADAYNRDKTMWDISKMTADELGRHLGGQNPVAYTTADGRNVTWESLYNAKRREEDEARIMGAADFKQYTTAGEAKGMDTAQWWEFWEKPENNIAHMRSDPNALENYEKSARDSENAFSAGATKNTLLDQIEYKAAKYMTDNEYAVYNYYVGKGETEQAEAYLASLEEDLNLRQANQMVRDVKGNRLKELEFAFEAGTNQFITGMRNIDNWITGKAPDLTPAVQYANSEIGGSLKGGWKVAYDLTSTTANMLPSILVSTIPVVGTTAGTASMGLSATGNAYSEMRNLGYDEGAAQNYAFLVGASESALQYALGGISKLGGKVSGNVISKVVNKVDNAIAKVAIKLSGSMLSEGVEEATQSVLEPIFKALTTGEDFEGIDIEGVVYSGLLGMLSAGLLEGGSTVAGSAIAGSEAKKNYGKGTELVAEALEINPNNTFAQKLQAKLDKGKALSGLALNELASQNEGAMVEQDTNAIRQAAEQRLTELGETGDVAAIAEVLAKQAKGEKLSVSDRYILRKSQKAQRVANELNPENIQSGQYSSSWAERIGTNRINAAEYGRILADLDGEGGVADNNVGDSAPVTVEAMSQGTETADVAESAPTEDAGTMGEFEAAEGKLSPEVGKPEATAVEPVIPEGEAPTGEITLEEVSEKYGAQAEFMRQIYMPGQDVEQFDSAYEMAYDMGRSGVPIDYAMNTDSTSYLTETQRRLAYEVGQKASLSSAQAQAEANRSAVNGKTGRRMGTVKGDGVTVSDLKQAFSDKHGTAYKLLSTYAEATGIDIVIYRSETDSDGNFRGAQGRFRADDNTIHIDLNAGLSSVHSMDDAAKYTMLRTFAHEFTHFLEKWDPVQYDELRRAVFGTMAERGESADELIRIKIEQTGLDYEAASREVVAEAMTDILPDANFAEQLAENHRTVFDKLIEKLKEFLADLKAYFKTIQRGRASTREAKALMEQIDGAVRYTESIVTLFDRVAVAAVENYQATVAEDEASTSTENTESTESTEEPADNLHDSTKDARNEDSGTQNEAVTTTNGDNDDGGDPFTVTENAEFGTLEVKFDSKPSEAVRGALKAHKFRWHGKKGIWYGKGERAELIRDLREAYKAEAPSAENVPEQGTSDTPTTQNRDTMEGEKAPVSTEAEKPGTVTDVYGDLADALNHSDLVKRNGMSFAVQGNETRGYYGIIKRINPDAGVYPVENVRDRIYRSGEFKTRQVAVDDLVLVARISELLKEAVPPEPAQTNTEEVVSHVQNVDNQGSVLESDPDGAGASRLLDESQAQDVRGVTPERESVEDSGQREPAPARDGARSDTDTGDRGSEGGSESGDLRRGGVVTRQDAEQGSDQDADRDSAPLRETAEREIEQRSTVSPKGSNFVIGDSLNLPAGEKAKFRANVDAIRLIKQIESEGRYATEAEQETLSKYVGWGGLDKAFGHFQYIREEKKSGWVPVDGWEREFSELKKLVDEGIISEQEYKNMSESTKNAHYTSIEVIKAMYDGLRKLGFAGGRMLEPSSGVGNFVGAMPTDMSAKVASWTMVELDRVTGQIAKYLYPGADVRVQGFETANIPDGYMDVAIGNVPFGNFGVVDRTYPNRVTKSIHNYFFAKSLDKVRPGGIVMFITSSFTMDSKDNAIRRYMMDRADLLGAIRLPNTAFKDNAGTEVVTDILVLKKREAGTAYGGEEFLEADYNGNFGTYVNGYFDKHPDMVLGKPVTKRGMYGASTMTIDPFTDRGTVGEQICKAFEGIKGTMDYPAAPSREKTNFAVQRSERRAKDGGFVVGADGSISRNEGGQLVRVDTDEKTAKRIAGMLSIRDAYKTLASYLQQGLDEKTIKKARKELNTAYDRFVSEYGPLNAPANRRAIDSDPDSYSIRSLENFDSKTKTTAKADIFTKDTISANRTVTHTDSVEDGVIASINLTGGVDAELIAKLTDKTAEDVTREIIASRLAFKQRDGSLVARETYLSGNVRAKLREAEALAPIDRDFEHNAEELRRVIPADIPYNEIYVTPGSTFIPNEVYADFIAHILGGRNDRSYGAPDVEVGRTSSGEFKIVVNNKRLKGGYNNNQTWGTARKSFLDLIDAMMGSRTVKVVDSFEDGDGKKISVLNEAETEAANEKVQAIQKEFEDWIWKDEGRRDTLARMYNEIFNALVNPAYDGSHLTVNGINPTYTLMTHQANAVHRIIASGGNTLLAHRVGAGKTLEMAAAAMKMRELGIIKKPVFVVPKSVVAQWGVEFKQYFPASRLLVSDEKSFTPANRKIFTNKIANGDYDAVILTYEQFEKIPMSADYQARFYQEQIDEIIEAIAEERAESRDGKGLTVKEMEKKKAQLEKRLKELTTKPKDEGNVDFEMLGIDSLFVDEAHNFKNLEYVSKMTNVAGLGSAKGSQRAFDLYTKTRYLQGLNGGRGIVFATATPVMNSMVELYIMQRYLQPDVLNQLGLKSFDAWAKQFGEVVNKWEINPSGSGMRQKQVFANFRNLSELQLLFRSFSDVVTELPYLKIPKMKGGAVKIVECEPGEFQRQYMQNLQERAEKVKSVDPKVDNMLKITSDGRKVSYTQRMIDPSLPYEPDCKIYRAAENILSEYKESADGKGTQIVFLDMATPKGTDKSRTDAEDTDSSDGDFDAESARLYDDLRDILIERGIPKREIAFIHEADSDAKRKQLFEDVNNGKVRVLIGSTGKMGVGMNAQKRVVAIHHLDAPWRPGDVEQRDGRAFRQRNVNELVSKYVYVTKGSFDSRLWDILDRKQHFINQIMNGEDVGRTAEDTGEVTLSAAEVKALASGNPLIEEQTKLTDAIKKLENLQKAYNSGIVLARTKLSDDQRTIAQAQSRIERIREDIAARVDTYSEGRFSMTVGKRTFTDKKDAGAALLAEIMGKAERDAYVTVGQFAGFDLRVIKDGAEYKGIIHGKEAYKFGVYMTNTTRMVGQIGEIVAGFENLIQNAEQGIADAKADLQAQEHILSKPFDKADELAEKRARFKEVMDLLAPKNEQQLGNEDEQEQSRAYLTGEQEQARANTLTDREVLSMAADRLEGDTNLSDGERDALRIFKSRLNSLRTSQEERRELGTRYKEQQFGQHVDRGAAAETLNRMHVLDDRIRAAEREVLKVEDTDVLRKVLEKARKVVEEEERRHGREILERWRDRTKNAAAIKKYRERIKADVAELSDWILKPDSKNQVKHVPDALKNTVIPFLTSIDFTSKRQLKGGEATQADKEFVEKLKKVNEVLEKQAQPYGENYSDYLDIPPGFIDDLKSYISTVEVLVETNAGEYVINKMTADELHELSKVVRTLKQYIMQINAFHSNALYHHVYEAGDALIDELSTMKSDKGRTGKVDNFLAIQNMRPSFVFERFGKAGIAMLDELQAGQDKYGFNIKEIAEFTEKAYTPKEVRHYRNTTKVFNIGGDKVEMRISHMMGLYLLSKQPDSLRHILNGGIRVATYKKRFTERVKGGKTKEIFKPITDDGHVLTQADIDTIVGQLSQREKDVADALQKFMAEKGSEWGNYVSVKRFGVSLFGNPLYYPIHADGTTLSNNLEEFPAGASLYALLNMGFTKSRNEEATNRIMLYDIFDVFSSHMSGMAQYNALALPILDITKWLNYQQKSEPNSNGRRVVLGSVREELTRVFGSPIESEAGKTGKGKTGYAVSFIENIIKDFNGTGAQGSSYDGIYMKILHNANRAKVSMNFRSAILQPTSIIRAGLVLDTRSILASLNPADIKKNTAEMLKYSGIAVWKHLGFYDVNVSRGMHEIITHETTFQDEVSEKGLLLAEKLDSVTWSAIWGAAKRDVMRKQKLTPQDAGFYDAVAKTFADVIYKTQVVDSVLTKSELMRSKSPVARTAASFMGEPVASVSMLTNAIDTFNRDTYNLGVAESFQKNGTNFAKTLSVYAVQGIVATVFGAMFVDMWRDDDEYEEWYEKLLDAIKGNIWGELNPLEKIPYVADAWESLETIVKAILNRVFGTDFYSYSQNTTLGQITKDLTQGVEILLDKAKGEDTKYTRYGGVYRLLQGISAISGLPFATLTREAVTVWNNTFGVLYPEYKVKTYDPGDLADIRYAYGDGYLTEEEATALLLEKGLVDSEDEAYFTIRGWEVGDGYSRYDAIYDAVLNGRDIGEAMAELTSRGYKEKDVIGQIKERIGKWYSDPESPVRITKEQARAMLETYTDMDDEAITKKLNQWSCRVVTGMAYGDIADAFMDGDITAARATEMYRLYGTMKREEAEKQVAVLQFALDHNVDHTEISYSFVEGYTAYCEDAGIDVGVFLDVWKFKNKATTDRDEDGDMIESAKEKTLEYVDSLPITRKQKNALYLALGYAESTIRDAPWR